jgi:hypothetical protein
MNELSIRIKKKVRKWKPRWDGEWELTSKQSKVEEEKKNGNLNNDEMQ